MALVISAGVLAYLVCGGLSYGLTLGYFQNAFGVFYHNRWEHLQLALACGLLGPLGFIPYWLTVESAYKWQLRFRLRSREDCRAEYKRRWPALKPDF